MCKGVQVFFECKHWEGRDVTRCAPAGTVSCAILVFDRVEHKEGKCAACRREEPSEMKQRSREEVKGEHRFPIGPGAKAITEIKGFKEIKEKYGFPLGFGAKAEPEIEEIEEWLKGCPRP